MKERLKKCMGVIVILLLLYPVSFLFKKIDTQKENTLTVLRSLNVQQVRSLKMYPRVIKPVGTPIIFEEADAIMASFFQSLSDIRSYSPSHDTVASRHHQWTLEMTTNNDQILILECYIPSAKGNIVAGRLKSPGWFQSQNLFKWYQEYKDRWLTPDEIQEDNMKP